MTSGLVPDPADPHGLLKTLIAHGVVVTPVDGRPDLYTATCPFDDDHPATVDTLARRRRHIAANPAWALAADNMTPGWRTQEKWQPAFQLRPFDSLFFCFGCGAGGATEDLTDHLTARKAS